MDLYEKAYGEGYRDGYKDGKADAGIHARWDILPPCFEEICMCSNCHVKFKYAYQHRDYCPNCGARMDLKKEG